MNKTELLSTYTAEQIAEMVITAMQSKEDDEKMIELITSAGNDLGRKLEDKKNEIACLKKNLDRSQNTINNIDYILEKLFGVRHDTVDKPDEFEKILAEKAKGSVEDFLPPEPIKVADMLISATYTRQKGNMEKAIHKAFGNNSDTVTENVYSESELRQIAEHLLVYCNHNEGGEDDG